MVIYDRLDRLPIAENSAIMFAFVLTTYKIVGPRNLHFTRYISKHFELTFKLLFFTVPNHLIIEA